MRLSFSLMIASVLAGSPVAALRAGSPADAAPPGKYFKLTPEAHKNADTFKLGQPIVGTSYFYWYDVYTGTHIRNPDGTDALTTHPPVEAMDDLSFRSPRWHYAQLRDVRGAGIDFIMPVFWGVPGQHEEWSFAGLPPLVAAHDQMTAEHKRDPSIPAPPKIGLFYDTSTLEFNRTSERDKARSDLTTDQGREWFYVTIRDFFSMIPPDKWARIDGRPIIFLYAASFAAAVDDKLFDDTRRRFKADFATDMFLVRHVDWPGRSDASYRWGGALGLTLGDDVAGLGPGYDHSAVPGRKPLVVSRRGGKFYEEQWEKLLRMHPQRRPWMVHVETWNEWHEGTDVARSQEGGDLYIQLTDKYARLFRAGKRLESTGPFANAGSVRWSGRTLGGIALLPSGGDGCWEWRQIDGAQAVVSAPSKEGFAGRYLYFDIDDSYLYDETDRAAEITIVFRDDGGCEQFCIEYDNSDPAIEPAAGAFRRAPAIPVGGAGTWRTVTLQLPQVRFCNRTNKGDLRLAVAGGERRLTVREVAVRRLPGTVVEPKR